MSDLIDLVRTKLHDQMVDSAGETMQSLKDDFVLGWTANLVLLPFSTVNFVISERPCQAIDIQRTGSLEGACRH